jgi:hypothetical protein
MRYRSEYQKALNNAKIGAVQQNLNEEDSYAHVSKQMSSWTTGVGSELLSRTSEQARLKIETESGMRTEEELFKYRTQIEVARIGRLTDEFNTELNEFASAGTAESKDLGIQEIKDAVANNLIDESKEAETVKEFINEHSRRNAQMNIEADPRIALEHIKSQKAGKTESWEGLTPDQLDALETDANKAITQRQSENRDRIFREVKTFLNPQRYGQDPKRTQEELDAQRTQLWEWAKAEADLGYITEGQLTNIEHMIYSTEGERHDSKAHNALLKDVRKFDPSAMASEDDVDKEYDRIGNAILSAPISTKQRDKLYDDLVNKRRGTGRFSPSSTTSFHTSTGDEMLERDWELFEDSDGGVLGEGHYSGSAVFGKEEFDSDNQEHLDRAYNQYQLDRERIRALIDSGMSGRDAYNLIRGRGDKTSAEQIKIDLGRLDTPEAQPTKEGKEKAYKAAIEASVEKQIEEKGVAITPADPRAKTKIPEKSNKKKPTASGRAAGIRFGD